MNIIALCQTRWDGPWLNRQQLLSRLGQRHTVLYSRGLWTVWERHEAEWRDVPLLGRFESRDNVLVDRPPRLLLRWPSVPAVDGMALRLGARRWLRRLRGTATGPLVAWVFEPWFYPYLSHLNAHHVVYHAYDYYNDYPRWNPTLERWQDEILASASLAFASSRYTADRLAERSGREVRFLPNGADFELFSTPLEGRAEPDDLAAIPRPRIGYLGRINRKVDLPLIARLARQRPAWQFVVVGGVANLDDETETARQRCAALANVHFLGEKPAAELPRYVGAMDVNLMCYRHGPGLWTDGIYPLKLHEYLAAGPPVVSTRLKSVQGYEHVLGVADDAGQWERAIDDALAGRGAGSLEQRRAVAAENSWDARVAVLDDALRSLAGRT